MIKLDQFRNGDFSRGVPAWKEGLWLVVRSVVFATWLPLPSSVKVQLLRAFGAKIGKGVIIRSRVNITMPWRFCCGDHVWIGDEVLILSLEEVNIGSSSCISQRAFLCTGSHDFSKTTFDLVTAPIRIGDSCWIGAQTFIGPGVVMANASRTLAGSVVVKDVDAGQTVGGVPAKVIGTVSHQGDPGRPSRQEWGSCEKG